MKLIARQIDRFSSILDANRMNLHGQRGRLADALPMLRIGHFPARSDNPYMRLLYAALERRRIATARGLRRPDLPGLAYRTDLDVVHFHWNLEKLWATSHPLIESARTPIARIVRRLYDAGLIVNKRRGLNAFDACLRRLRRRGVRVIWTVHELDPPEYGSPLDREGYQILVRYADGLLCHSEYTRREIVRRWTPTCPIEVMAIGNYDEVYQCPIDDRARTLRQFGLDGDRPIVAMLGKIRWSKGADIACRAMAALNGKVQLVIAGHAVSAELLQDLERIAHGFPSVHIIGRALSDEEFCRLGHASDIFVLPYRAVTGSSALIAAFTMSRAAVVSDLPYFREIDDGLRSALCLVRPEDPDALADGIQRLLDVPADERSYAARRIADRHAWDVVIEPYVNWLEGRSGVSSVR